MQSNLNDIFRVNNNVVENVDDSRSNLEVSSILSKAEVPFSHRRIAYNYKIMKDMCNFQIAQPRITNVEKALLAKYSFLTLEQTSITQVNNEIKSLKTWATSLNDVLRLDSEELLNIRVRELKFILSDNYTINSNEVYRGYEAIEAYLLGVCSL